MLDVDLIGLTYTITWRTLCVDLIGPYTIKGKNISRCNRL